MYAFQVTISLLTFYKLTQQNALHCFQSQLDIQLGSWGEDAYLLWLFCKHYKQPAADTKRDYFPQGLGKSQSTTEITNVMRTESPICSTKEM